LIDGFGAAFENNMESMAFTTDLDPTRVNPSGKRTNLKNQQTFTNLEPSRPFSKREEEN